MTGLRFTDGENTVPPLVPPVDGTAETTDDAGVTAAGYVGGFVQLGEGRAGDG